MVAGSAGTYLQLLCGWVESNVGGPTGGAADFSTTAGPHGTQFVSLHAWSPRMISLVMTDFLRDVHHRGDLWADWVGAFVPPEACSEGAARLAQGLAGIHHGAPPVGFVVAGGVLVASHDLDLDALDGTARSPHVLAELLATTAPGA